MEVMEAIRKRQSVRKFKDGDIPDKDIEAIIEAAGLAPSGKNSQNWYFLVIKNRELMQKIGDAVLVENEKIALRMDAIDEAKGLRFRKFVKNFTMFYTQAPVLVAVFTRDYFPSGYQELSFIGAPKYRLDDLFRRNPGMQNLGACLENFTLRAIDLGYGSCWMTSQNYAADQIEGLLKDELGFEKEDHYLAAMMALGIPEDNLKSPAKKSVSEIYQIIR